jgi:hypothetical protein
LRNSLPCLLFALLAIGCRDTASPVKQSATASPARVPVALLGTWVRTPSRDARHDTLVLRADSIATGWLRLESDSTTVIAVSRWTVAFLSRDPAVARTDMPGRYQDGGDARCAFRPDSTCVSAPVFCFGPVGQLHCQGMTFRHNTLWLSGEGRYVRIGRRDSVAP